MIPGMNPRKMQQMMKKMGVSQVDIPATEVIIKTPEVDLIIRNPGVSKVNMMGQDSLQITGDLEELPKEPEKIEISEEDVKTVVEQTGAPEDKVREVLEKNKGDLAAAIMELKRE